MNFKWLFILILFLPFVNARVLFYESFDNSTSIEDNEGVVSAIYHDERLLVSPNFSVGIRGNSVNLSGNKKVCYPLRDNLNWKNGTIQFLLKPNVNGGLFDMGFLGSANSWGIFRPSASSYFWVEVKNYLNYYTQKAVTISGGDWNLISLIYYRTINNTYFRICSNDQCSSWGVRDHNFLSLDDDFCVGWTGWYGYSNGVFDELKIFDYPKSLDEISEDYGDYFGACSVDSDCGEGQYIGNNYCVGDSVYRNYSMPVCNLPGDINSFCSEEIEKDFIEYCEFGCDNGLCNSIAVKNVSNGNVRVEGRKLFVDGKEYIVKSIGYSPTPIGKSPDYGYDVTVHSDLRARDFPLLRDMNANTIRTWGKVGEVSFLDDAWNNGARPLRVIMGYWMGPEKDYMNLTVRNEIKSDFENYVRNFKDHPAVLIWAIGNEENYFYGNTNQKHAAYFSLVNEMAEIAYSIEGEDYHPVMAVSLEFPNRMDSVGNSLKGSDDANLTYVDMWGINHYPGESFGDWFNVYASKTSKPLIITEYGIDAFNQQTGQEYEDIQAKWNLDLWEEINSSVAVGGSLMAYSDEYWKAGDPWTHNTGGYATTSHPDGYSNEEYWGMVRVEKNNSGIDIVIPRQTYYSLGNAFSDSIFCNDSEDLLNCAGEFDEPSLWKLDSECEEDQKDCVSIENSEAIIYNIGDLYSNLDVEFEKDYIVEFDILEMKNGIFGFCFGDKINYDGKLGHNRILVSPENDSENWCPQFYIYFSDNDVDAKGRIDNVKIYHASNEDFCGGADIDRNGVVDLNDASKLLSNWESICSSNDNWCNNVDTNNDGIVDSIDAKIIMENWGRQDCYLIS